MDSPGFSCACFLEGGSQFPVIEGSLPQSLLQIDQDEFAFSLRQVITIPHPGPIGSPVWIDTGLVDIGIGHRKRGDEEGKDSSGRVNLHMLREVTAEIRSSFNHTVLSWSGKSFFCATI